LSGSFSAAEIAENAERERARKRGWVRGGFAIGSSPSHAIPLLLSFLLRVLCGLCG
jgi:hypothetical protein